MLNEKMPSAGPISPELCQDEYFRYRDVAENSPDSKPLHTPARVDPGQADESAAPVTPTPAADAMVPAVPDSTAEPPVPIPEDSTAVTELPFVTVEPVVNPRPHRKRKLPLLVAGIAAALILAAGLLAWKHFDSYEEAVTLAREHSFQAARDVLFLPELADLHDPDFALYLRAGTAMERGLHEDARNVLENLPRNYRDTHNLLLEIDYQQAKAVLEQCDYALAIRLFAPLKDAGYLDSPELYCRARMEQANQEIAQIHTIADVKSGLQTLDTLISEGYIPAKVAKHNALELIYDHGISLYESEIYNVAVRYLQLAEGYSHADDYIDLCYAYYNELSLDDLWDLRSYEDASSLLLEDYYLTKFLQGSWYTRDRGYHLSMSANGYLSYTLPWVDFGDCYRIEAGEIRLYYDRNYYDAIGLYKITIVSWREISVYCYQNNRTYTLYRE